MPTVLHACTFTNGDKELEKVNLERLQELGLESIRDYHGKKKMQIFRFKVEDLNNLKEISEILEVPTFCINENCPKPDMSCTVR